jgi:antitoxin component HigA of HigAB toxin-antitoxin module
MTDHDRPDDATLRAAARGLHHEWDSPQLWPRIENGMRRSDSPVRRWAGLAAAALVVVSLGATGWLLWRGSAPSTVADVDREERLLSEQAFKDVERSEEQYTRAIEELSRLVAPKLDMPESALLIALRDRLQTIDTAIAESRAQIEQNPFNAQLRRQLLYIYQEKRRTLEQIQDHDETL